MTKCWWCETEILSDACPAVVSDTGVIHYMCTKDCALDYWSTPKVERDVDPILNAFNKKGDH
jgi:hypothetical protein